MQKSNKFGLIRYEFIAYIHVLGTQNVNEILLTKDDSAETNSQGDQIKWTSVENMDIDNVDNGEININSIVKTKKRICGLFDAEPLDWEYARIIVSDSTKSKQSYAIARIPKSPTVPVFFDVKE